MSGSFSAAAAAALYACGLLLLFLIRSQRHKAATGSSGFNGFTKTSGVTARVAGICFAVAVVVGLLAPILAFAQTLPHAHDPVGGPATALARWVGLLLTAVGFAAAVVAQNTMGVSWRIGVDPAERTELVTHGVFARVRNPIFTAMIAAQTGTALMAPSWVSLLGVLLLLVGIQLQVRSIEEPYLARVHHDAYLAYAAQTGRFLPGVGRLTHPPTQPVQTRKETVS